MSRKIFEDCTNTALLKPNQQKKPSEEPRQDGIEIDRIHYNPNQQVELSEYATMANDRCPVLSIPTEISCMIFKLLVAGQNSMDLETREKAPLPEVVVSHVCQRWREVSLAYPQLWTKFIFCASNVQCMHNPINRLDAYLKRSGSQNLELFFNLLAVPDRYGSLPFSKRSKHPSEREEDQAALLEKAVKEVQRWKIVTFLFPNLNIETRFPHLVMASAPNLEYFSYSPRVSLIEETANHSMHALFEGGTPKLRYLLLQSLTFKIPSSSVITTLRLETTFSYDMVSYSWNTFLEILSIPSLMNLSMDGNLVSPPENDGRGNHIVTMNNLKHLRYSCQDFMTLLLPFIRAPLLETLLICMDDGVAEEERYNPFGIPSDSCVFPSLETLILIDSTYSADSVRRIIRMTANIKNIVISHVAEGDYHFFVDLQDDGHLNECWPKLTSFTANLVSPDNIDAFADFLFSRPKNTLTVRLFDKTNYNLETELPGDYEEIREHCTLEVLSAEEQAVAVIRRPLWPPGADCPEYAYKDDVFRNF